MQLSLILKQVLINLDTDILTFSDSHDINQINCYFSSIVNQNIKSYPYIYLILVCKI